MKTTRLRAILFACGILAVFVAGFYFGGVYASISAARSANAASLVYFSGIHEALNHQRYDYAATVTNNAVDNHIRVLRELNTQPWMVASTFVWPWKRSDYSLITAMGIYAARKSYKAEPDTLWPETRDFIAASH